MSGNTSRSPDANGRWPIRTRTLLVLLIFLAGCVLREAVCQAFTAIRHNHWINPLWIPRAALVVLVRTLLGWLVNIGVQTAVSDKQYGACYISGDIIGDVLTFIVAKRTHIQRFNNFETILFALLQTFDALAYISGGTSTELDHDLNMTAYAKFALTPTIFRFSQPLNASLFALSKLAILVLAMSSWTILLLVQKRLHTADWNLSGSKQPVWANRTLRTLYFSALSSVTITTASTLSYLAKAAIQND